jgi:hypothetical protein
MDLRTLTNLLLRLIGLYWLTASLVSLISIGAMTLTAAGTDTTPYRAYTSFGYIVVGAALVWFPGTIVNRVLRIEGAELEGGITAKRLLGVGVSLLGLYFTVVALSALVFSIGGFGELGGKFEAEQGWALVAWLVQLAIGLTLVFARRRVMSLITDQNDR